MRERINIVLRLEKEIRSNTHAILHKFVLIIILIFNISRIICWINFYYFFRSSRGDCNANDANGTSVSITLYLVIIIILRKI